MDEKGDKTGKESVLLQIELRFHEKGEKRTEDNQDELTKSKSMIII